ncbi:DUF3795 domain-containing protein [Candidatus Bipolaricaulota bacterium]
MSAKEIGSPESLNSMLIAPCGMNCGLCSGYLRGKKQCPGCHGEEEKKPKYCIVCRIKTCEELAACEGEFCHACDKFPCARLRQLDKRYRTKYGVSMIGNLETIREIGLDEFVTREKKRWTCPECGVLICVHKENCLGCGRARD